MSSKSIEHRRDKGIGLIIVIVVLAFLLTVGVALLTVISAGPKISGNVRFQEQAFNAAEAGFDAAFMAIEDFFTGAVWTSFDGQYLVNPTGIDLPSDQNNYFRRLTDEEILSRLESLASAGGPYSDGSGIVFYKKTYILDTDGNPDPKYTYTVFLIDDEAETPTADPGDVIMVCIGAVETGGRLTTSRLEIELAIELSGT
jgi:hypothetical protein